LPKATENITGSDEWILMSHQPGMFIDAKAMKQARLLKDPCCEFLK